MAFQVESVAPPCISRSRGLPLPQAGGSAVRLVSLKTDPKARATSSSFERASEPVFHHLPSLPPSCFVRSLGDRRPRAHLKEKRLRRGPPLSVSPSLSLPPSLLPSLSSHFETKMMIAGNEGNGISQFLLRCRRRSNTKLCFGISMLFTLRCE